MAASGALKQSEIRAALLVIRAWQQAKGAEPVPCPRCAADGLVIVDQSSRPYAEWYALKCKACGLDDALHIPMAGPSSS